MSQVRAALPLARVLQRPCSSVQPLARLARPVSGLSTRSSTRRQSTSTLLGPSAAGTVELPVFGRSAAAQPQQKRLQGEFALVGDDALASQSTRRPLVLMLGWGGASDRQLAKFSTMWEEQGFAVARYTAPMHKCGRLQDYPRFAAELLDRVWDSLRDRPILLHLFSMNGCNVYLTLLRLLDAAPGGAEVKRQMRGIILDSGPADVSPLATSMAIALSAFPPGSSALGRQLYFALWAAYYQSQRLAVWARARLLGQPAYADTFGYFAMRECAQLPREQLYFFSDGDSICEADSVQQFVRHQERDRGARAEVHRFDKSQHVQHFRKHPELYTQACLKFAQRTLPAQA